MQAIRGQLGTWFDPVAVAPGLIFGLVLVANIVLIIGYTCEVCRLPVHWREASTTAGI